jgi:hypothetical protein
VTVISVGDGAGDGVGDDVGIAVPATPICSFDDVIREV